MIELDKLTESIWHDLHETVDWGRVRQVLVDLLPKYREARILTFVPILIRRDAIEALRH